MKPPFEVKLYIGYPDGRANIPFSLFFEHWHEANCCVYAAWNGLPQDPDGQMCLVDQESLEAFAPELLRVEPF